MREFNNLSIALLTGLDDAALAPLAFLPALEELLLQDHRSLTTKGVIAATARIQTLVAVCLRHCGSCNIDSDRRQLRGVHVLRGY